MPPTGRRRRNKEPEQRVDAEAAEATTPSRKRRRVNGPNNASATAAAARATRRASAESDATIENQEGEEDGMDGPPELREAEAIIQRLRLAHYPVQVATDHNNAVVPPNEQAFAKIAGRNWTFYVKTTNVVIGRPNSKQKRESMAPEEAGTGTPSAGMNGGFEVQIDLGPDQQISRVHAEIVYDAEQEVWMVICNGRNGLHLDDRRVERGQRCNLHSGAVLSILGTQMIFILPNELPLIHPMIRRALLEEGDAEDEQYRPGDGAPKGTNIRYGGQGTDTSPSNPFSKPAGGNTGSGTQAAHALAALSSSRDAPGTPRLPPPQPKSKNSPAYAVKGVMIESTEEIDYSADNAKDIKPPHSYAQMIGQAIMSREGENATLSQIYEFIKEHYAFFRHGGGGWQNSIRHNLSLSKHFEKIPRRTDEPGKGMKWQIVPEFREEYMKKNFHESRRPMQRRLDSSGPNSPAAAMQTQRLMGVLDTNPASIKRHSGSPSPSRLHTYPVPNESYTPDRGPRLHTHHLPLANGAANPTSATSELVTPTFERANPLASQQIFSGTSHHQGLTVDSPPGLHTGMANDNTVGHGIVHTPLPARSAPKQFQSTIKPPSFYTKELFSSPAPFWKYLDPGSTPLRPMPDLSPEKFAKPIAAEDDEEIKTDFDDEEDLDEKPMTTPQKKEEDDEKPKLEDEEAMPTSRAISAADNKFEPVGLVEDTASGPPPSSPPGNKLPSPLEEEAPDESPTRTVSRPVSRREPAPGIINGANTELGKVAPPPAQPKFNLHTAAAPRFGLYGHHGQNGMVGVDDEDEDEGIDLSKTSFQKIGQYHRVMNAARPAPAAPPRP